jgi:membrane dipeptidase
MRVPIAAACALFAAAPAFGAPPRPTPAESAHAAALVLDTHFDTPANLAVPGWDILKRHSVELDGSQVDLPRMNQGGVDGGFFAVFTEQGLRGPAGNAAARDAGLMRAVAIREMLAAHPRSFALATSAEDAAAIARSGRKFVYISMENGSPVAGDLTLMRTFYELGVRMMGPVHFANNDLADSSTDPKGAEWGGLSPQGRRFVAEANRLGIVLDASHASDQVLDQMLELSSAPIILSHSGLKAVFDHPRNIDDDRLRALAAKGGVIQINAFSAYMVETPRIPERRAALEELERVWGDPAALPASRLPAYAAARRAIDARWPLPRATLDDFMKHLLHAIEVAGVNHVGVSGDFDGGGGIEGLEDVTGFPRITERLLKAGFSQADIAKIWGGNALRLLREAERLKER